ncbi:hypothetical protein [Agromyces binzhouensis]|uniref:Uncharacterized protein n=1 Tax=Agromyces binzhouensis TaxID=1817495 RepID=A0A4Q2JK78_9MICO|nr:hypothetical protein [Agromyces binzhouensis]RXZ46298.1 hypothetical protein ESO86_10665 [Agromyces binzhouensis]
MTEHWRRVRCPRCGETSTALVAVVPTMGDAGLAVVDYRCPSGCRHDDVHDELDEALGIRHALG